MAKNKQIQNMVSKGQEYVLNGEYSKALMMGQKLLKAGETYGHVIQAQAHNLKGKPELAVDSIKRLTDSQPEHLYAWRMLAELYRDLGKFDLAEDAYDKASKCPDAPWQRIALAKASVMVMAERYQAALESLNEIVTEDVAIILPVEALKCTCFNSMGAHQKALDLALETIEKVKLEGPEILEDAFTGLMYNLYHDLSRAYWQLDQQSSKALNALYKSLEYTNSAPVTSLRLLREINALELSGEEKALRIQLRARLNRPVMAHGHAHYDYHRQYDVACIDVAEAMEYIHELEFIASLGSIKLLDVRELQGSMDKYRGVYFQSPIRLEHNQ